MPLNEAQQNELKQQLLIEAMRTTGNIVASYVGNISLPVNDFNDQSQWKHFVERTAANYPDILKHLFAHSITEATNQGLLT